MVNRPLSPYLQLVTLLLTLISMCALAQEPYLKFGRVDGDQSVTNTIIQDIKQDSLGFMWFATRGHGLVRYDGYDFRVFRAEPGNPHSLSHNDVASIDVDTGGTMRVSTADGINIYDPTTESFEHVDVMPEDPDQRTRFTTATVIDKQGTLWAARGRDLYRKDKGSDTVRIYPVEAANPSAWMSFFVGCLLLDSNGTLWAGTSGGGLLRYEPDTDSFSRFMHDPNDTSSIAGDTVNHIYEDSTGYIWISTDSGLSKKEKGKDAFYSYFVSTGNLEYDVGATIGPILEDSHGNFWVAVANQGIVLLDRQSGSYIQYSHDPGDPGSLASNTVHSLFEDRSGVIWLGSDPINRLMPSNHAFTRIDNPVAYVGARRRIPDSMIQSSDGSIWLDGMEGADRYDPNSGTWQRISLFPEDPANPQNEVTTIHEDEIGTIWLGHPNYLSRIDPKTRVQSSIRLPSKPVDIHVDRAGRIWLSLPKDAGLFEADFDSGTVRHVSIQRWPIVGGISHGYTSFLSEDDTGRLWVGAYNGLNQFQPNTEEFINYFPDDTDLSSISDKEILSISESPDGSIWIGTVNGLNRFEPATSSFERFFNGESAHLNRINGIAQGANDRLWITTGGGLAEFDPTTGVFQNFDAADGMPGLIGKSIVRGTHDGLIYMATTSGLISMDPTKVGPTSTVPAVVFTDFRLQNRPVLASKSHDGSLLSSSITTTENITLRPEHSIISFGFSALDFVNPAENQYAYKLDGFDDDWIQTDSNRRIASYTNLPAGDYEFRVKAANSAGVWNEAGAVIELTVLPPWFMTQWAYLVYAVLVISFITALVQFRTRTLRIRGRELAKLVDERTEELKTQKDTIEQQALNLEELIITKDRYFTNVSHEFRTPLAVILGPIDRLLTQISDIEARRYLQTVRRNGSRLLRMVDQLLGFSRLESGRTEVATAHSVKSTIAYITASLEYFASDKHITLDIETVEDVWVQSSGDALEEIVINLLSNALKYTPSGGKVDVSATQDDACICLTVADTGPGIPANQHENIFQRFYRVDDLAESAPGSGLGLALVKDLVTANGGEIVLDSTEGVGTTIRIMLPAAEAPCEAPQKHELTARTLTIVELGAASLLDSTPVGQRISDDTLPNMLVIEDNLDLCRHLEEVFGNGLHCSFAHDGQTGLDSAIDDIPDVIICDAMLPKVNGFEVTRQLKQDDRTSHIPIIMLTARVDERSRLRGLKALADDYVTKPFNEAELRQRVDTMLAVREILRLRYSKEAHQMDASEFKATMSERDRRFIGRVDDALAQHFSDPEFSTSRFASDVAMSERQLQRKLRALMNYTPREYLRNYRLQEAAKMLQAGASVADAAYSVGFLSLSYFAKCFKAQFGLTPSDVLDGSSEEEPASDNVG